MRRPSVRGVSCRLVLVLVLSPVAACSSGAPPDGISTLTEPECPPNASCASGFEIDGVFHAVSCGAVRADLVSGRVIAKGSFEDEPTEVREVDGVDPSLLVAVRRPGGTCEGRTTPLSPWSMAYPERGTLDAEDQRELHLVSCRLSPAQQQRRNRCPIPSPLSSRTVQAMAPLAAYDPVDWPRRPSDLLCDRGMGRSDGVPAGARRATFPTAAAVLRRAEETALTHLSGPTARASLSAALRQLRPTSAGYEELFFRGDVVPVAWLRVERTRDGSWRWVGYATCEPASGAGERS